MKVTIEIEGKPSEVAALVGEIAGRHESSGCSIGSINCLIDESVERSVSNLFEALAERGSS